jgi:serine/threonine protein kinase
MNHQQPHYPAAIQHHNAPQRRAAASYRIGPTGQREILSNAIGIPRQFPIPFATVAQSAIRGSAGQANQANREAPSINSSFISRIYSAQIPNQSFPPKLLVQALDQELKIIKADDYFISHLFPTTLLPSGMNDETVIAELSKPLNGESIWNTRRECFRTKPSSLKESDLAVWLNSIGTTLGKAFGYEPLRLWSHRSCETPAIGASSSITRKPDLILLDKKYYDELQDPQHPTDWAFIRAFGEVTSSGSISKRMTDSINSKAYLMFLCQYNRRFVVALSFTAAEEESFRLTVTDREGQIQWTVGLTTARSRERSLLFLRILIILMFGSSSDIGLDPNIEIDHTGRCVAITVQEKRFQVVDLIYSLNSVVGRGTRVWSVMHDGVNYTLKDCWVQHERVHSEVEILRKIKESKQFTGRVPTLFCGGDVQINGVVDCTDRYRSGLPGWSWKTQRIHRQLVCTPIGEPLSKYRSKQEFIKAIISILISASLYFTKCGKSHHRFLAHRMLFNDHGILHRDISLNNILFYRPKEDETADGLLIDFDYSEELDIDDGEELDTLDDSEELDILDADGEHAMGEREARIDEATDLEEDKAGTTSRESETGSSIRTVRSHFINCPWR